MCATVVVGSSQRRNEKIDPIERQTTVTYQTLQFVFVLPLLLSFVCFLSAIDRIVAAYESRVTPIGDKIFSFSLAALEPKNSRSPTNPAGLSQLMADGFM